MIVVFDSSILCQDFHLSSSGFIIVFDGAAELGITLCFPEVVVAEVINKFAEGVRKHLLKIHSSRRDLARLLREPVLAPFEKTAVDEHVAKYGAFLRGRLAQTQASVPAFPSPSHEVLVTRALARRKPFSSDGQKGYRDALIWHTLLDMVAPGSETVALITANTKDFADEDGALHHDLVADLETRGIPKGDVELYTSLDDFTTAHIVPSLAVLDVARQQLDTRTYSDLDLCAWFTSDFTLQVVGVYWDSADLGLPLEFEDITLASVDDISSLTVSSVRRLRSGELLIAATLVATCEFDVLMFKQDYWLGMDGRFKDLNVWDPEYSEHYIAASDTALLSIGVDMIFDESTKEVVSLTVKHASSSRARRE